MMPPKDPDSVEPYFVVWCDIDGTNTGAASDAGELQGQTIATVTWTFADTTNTGRLQEDTTGHNQDAVTIAGVSYGINTVAKIWLKAGVDATDYDLECKITTSGGTTLVKTITIPVRAQ